MRLLQFHRVLIGAGILFCLGFGLYEGFEFRAGAGRGALALAVVFLLAALLLALYWMNLSRLVRIDRSRG